MKLNPSCIRDIMFFLEHSMEPDEYGKVPSIRPVELVEKNDLSKYPQNEIMYHVRQLFETNLLKPGKRYVVDILPSIADITPEGHQLPAALHSDTVWNKILSHFKTAGSIALSQMIQLAINGLAT